MAIIGKSEILRETRQKFSNPIIPEGVRAFSKLRHLDHRGYFQEDLTSDDLKDLGFGSFFQRNVSLSGIGVVRGMHWQSGKAGQTKIVTCSNGAVLDVIVDLRLESPTYGEINSFLLSANEPRYLIIPKGFAHGFQSLQENTIFSYYVDAPYSPENEFSISPLSDEFESYWNRIPKIVSKKDEEAIMFKEYISNNMKKA